MCQTSEVFKPSVHIFPEEMMQLISLPKEEELPKAKLEPPKTGEDNGVQQTPLNQYINKFLCSATLFFISKELTQILLKIPPLRF